MSSLTKTFPTPDGWRMVKVKDITTIGRGRVISQQDLENHPGIYPIYSSQSKDGGVFGHIDTFDFDGEYVTWTTDGAYAGTVFYRSGQFNCTNVCGTLRAKNKDLNMKYLASSLSTRTSRYVSYIGNPKLMNNVMAEIYIPLPPPKEQCRIANILDTLDTQTQQTEQLIAKLKQMKIGLLHGLFTKGIDENGDVRDPVAHPEKFKNSVLGSIPKGWKVGKFEALANIIDPQPSHRAPAEVVGGEPYVGVGDLREDGSINFESCRKVSLKAVIKQEQRFSIEAGDIIFGKIGTIGFPQFLPQGIRYALNANTVIIKPKHCPLYVLWLLRSSLVEKQIQMQIHSTTQPAFGIQRIRAMLVPIPDKNEQNRISLILDSHNVRITAEEIELAKLKQLKKGLMHDLLTGRVRVTQLMAESGQLGVRSKWVSDYNCK